MKLNRMMITVLMVLLLQPVVYAASTIITVDQWERPRSGRFIVQTDGLRKLVDKFDKSNNKYFTIHYRSGDKGVLWAEEFRAWLVALGIQSSKILLLPGLKVDERHIEIELRSGKPEL